MGSLVACEGELEPGEIMFVFVDELIAVCQIVIFGQCFKVFGFWFVAVKIVLFAHVYIHISHHDDLAKLFVLLDEWGDCVLEEVFIFDVVVWAMDAHDKCVASFLGV